MKRLTVLLLITLLFAGIVQASGGPVSSMEAVPSPLLPIAKNHPVTFTAWWGIEAE